MKHHSSPPRLGNVRRQRGSVVVYLALALVAFGVMAVAGASRFGASILGVGAPNCSTQARLMAESGVRYATAYLRGATDNATLNTRINDLNTHGPYTVDATKGQSFTLTVAASGTGAAQVSATGTACGGASFLPSTSATASASGGVNVPAAGGGGGTPGEGISSEDFGSMVVVGGGGITVDTTAGTIEFGGGLYSSSAAAWYTGSRDVCADGNCTLGNGLCAYFRFDFASTSKGDGFVWTLMSGDTNTIHANGGDPSRGELLGYGGLGSSGLGIQPPKLGVEFDIYKNSGTASVCNVGNRADDSNGYDHMAHVFWGLDVPLPCDATYDDNRHGAGSGSTSEPMNARNDGGDGSGYDGYYYRSGGGGGWGGGWGGGGSSADWLKSGGTFYYRYELDRSTTANVNGDYCYQIRSWLKKSTDTFPSGLNNCTVAYSGPPDATSVINLSPAMHQKLQKIIFGWTEGTGGATQLATLRDFQLNFKPVPTLPVVPQDYVSGWSFYETTGSTVHDMNATNHNDGTISGTGQWVPGIGCPNCAGLRLSDNGRIAVPDSNSLDLSASGSIACWVNLRETPNWDGLVHKGTDLIWFSDETYSFQFIGNRQVRLYINAADDSTRSVTSAALPNNDQWYHVATTWDATTLKIYVNGALSASAANTGGKAAKVNASAVTIGAQGPGWPYYSLPGTIDEVYLYNRALTATEIANMALGHP